MGHGLLIGRYVYASLLKQAGGVYQDRSLTSVSVQGRENDCSWSLRVMIGTGLYRGVWVWMVFV